MLLVFGSGFLTDVTGEALATLAGLAPPRVPGDPAGPPPPARDSLKKKKEKKKSVSHRSENRLNELVT